MRVNREQVREKVVEAVVAALAPIDADFRVRWPGDGPADVSVNKSPYANVDLVYQDGVDVGLGPEADSRLLGTIVVEFCYKQGDAEGMRKVNTLIDYVMRALTSNDSMFPVRTYATRQVTPASGAQEGWNREGLVTPFWFDTSKA